MKKSAIEIRGDLFGIADRLKAIDDGYFIVYDTSSGKFEVHNKRQRGDTFSLSVPYPCLDARTVTLVQKTRAENAKRIIEEMERENMRLERMRIKEITEKAASKVF